MPIPQLGNLGAGTSYEDLLNYVIRLERKLDFVLQTLDSENIFEAGGWRVTPTQLASKDNDVGMSTEDTAGDDVRFFAGGTAKDTAPWRVQKSGKMVATGALIQSKDGTYPRVVVDPANDLFGAYGSATQSIVIEAFGNTSTPFLQWNDGTHEIKMYLSGSQLNIISATVGMDIEVAGDLDLKPINLYLYPDSLVHVVNWGKIYSDGALETLQEALDAKATAGAATNLNGAHNHGIPNGATWTTSAGTVTWSAAAAHAHNQT